LPNKAIISSTGTGQIALAPELSISARTVQILPQLKIIPYCPLDNCVMMDALRSLQKIPYESLKINKSSFEELEINVMAYGMSPACHHTKRQQQVRHHKN